MRSGPSPARPRVRLTLLVLLWAFAGTVFLVVDLFLNVPAFDEVRPRAKLYRSMRYVGHTMVGEPYLDADEFAALGLREPVGRFAPPPADLAAGLAAARAQSDARVLRAWATGRADTRVRVESLERLALLEGAEARPLLMAVAGDGRAPTKLRAAAARLVGRTGPDALASVEELLACETAAVRAGAAAALVPIESPEAAARTEAILRGPHAGLRRAIADAVARERTPRGRAVATQLVRDATLDAPARVALCWALCEASDESAAVALAGVAEDESSPAELRRAARVALRSIRSRAAASCVSASPTAPRNARPGDRRGR